ncbi:hypothetical protein C8Q80DRAFT_1275763 [Daedaleopsis nitida]|nr:hypothetical protein C8Q80DRAFT_1275763 [Daedaleopsis nitida]
MTSPPSISFSKPAMPGDALSVLVLVEDSDGMATKWPDVRDSYLPNLFDKLRSADPSVQMEARWLTTSSASRSPPPVPIMDSAQARAAHDIPLGYTASAKLCPGAISNAINILSSASGRQSTTRHLILVAATGPLSHAQGGLSDATPSGFDSWDEIAIVLKQYYIRLHVILSIGAEMRTYHELFKRSLQLQNNSEVPAWFPVDSRRYSIRLCGRPQYVRGSAALPISLVPTAIPEDMYNNPSPPAPSPPPVSPPTTASTPSSPPHSASPGARKSSTSPITPRSRPRASDAQQPPAGSEGGGLVSYLQQMHGLTKKKSYGIKAPKKTYADMRLPNAGRPILPRLEVPQSQSDIYTYPTFDNVHSADIYLPPSDPQLLPPRRHSVEQLPSASLVTRTSNEDRRARRRGPWLPITPLVSSTPSSPTSTTSPGTLAALQSLASMTPRLPDFGTMAKDRMNPSAMAVSDSPAAYAVSSMPVSTSPSGGYYSTPLTSWGKQPPGGAAASPNSSAPSPTHTASSTLSDASRFQTSPPTPSLMSDYTYGSSPPSSTSATPPSITAPIGQGDSGEDQPFVVSPEYEAMVNQRFDEAVRSGAMQASMTGAAIHPAAGPSAVPGGPGPGPGSAGVPSGASYASAQTVAHARHDASSYYSQVMSHADRDGYTVYHPHAVHAHGEYAVAGAEVGGGWQYGIDDQYFPPQADYAHAQGPWYS